MFIQHEDTGYISEIKDGSKIPDRYYEIACMRGWSISHEPTSIPYPHFDYNFSHENHDGENGLCGIATSHEDAIRQIMIMVDEKS